MAFFNKKKFSFDSVKQAVSDTTAKVSDSIKNTDLKGAVETTQNKVSDLYNKATESSKNAYENTANRISESYESAKDAISSFDYSQLKNKEFYYEKGKEYANLSSEKILAYFKGTLEIDKSTMEIVDEVKRKLPVPVETVDDIFDQCKKEAIRRTISLFMLKNLSDKIDSASEDKYSKLSIDYKGWYDENEYYLNAGNENFASMQNQRSDAQPIGVLEDGYNKTNILYAPDADIEHIIAKKEFFDDFILKIGTTDSELTEVIGSKENLIFTDKSLNRSLQERNIFEYLNERGSVDPDNPDLVHIEIKGKIRTVNKKDVEEAYAVAEKSKHKHQIEALKEVGATVVTTGAYMATQQVVGLIIVETIDIFTDEIKSLAVNGQLINSDGWLQNTKDATNRIQSKLAERFEERQIWARAKSLGIESGVAGALSVIPQIIISMLVKVPAFILALIRESTLSVVRCVRVLMSNDENKLNSIKIILAGAASAIVGLYVGRAIGSAIAGVPLLNRFNKQVTDILTGLLITAVPLAAIYAFERNKNKLDFVTNKLGFNNKHNLS